ncbi:MAG: hypothetical protein U0V70_03635 [Terriglobia bacterium]
MNLRRTRAVAKKEFLHILRDTRSLILALVLPMLMLLLFGYALSLDVDELPVLVWDQDKTPESRELVERFRTSCFFKVLGVGWLFRIGGGDPAQPDHFCRHHPQGLFQKSTQRQGSSDPGSF